MLRLVVGLKGVCAFIEIVTQGVITKRGDSNKTYRLDEPDVKCYVKGKEHNKFEFGSKASILIDQQTGITMWAINATETLFDSKIIPQVLEQYERLNRKQAKELYVDRGHRVIQQYNRLVSRFQHLIKTSSYHKERRIAKELPYDQIGHLKQDYR